MNIYYPLIIFNKKKYNIYTYILNDKIINMYILYQIKKSVYILPMYLYNTNIYLILDFRPGLIIFISYPLSIDKITI